MSMHPNSAARDATEVNTVAEVTVSGAERNAAVVETQEVPARTSLALSLKPARSPREEVAEAVTVAEVMVREEKEVEREVAKEVATVDPEKAPVAATVPSRKAPLSPPSRVSQPTRKSSEETEVVEEELI